ncbi:MAG: hypothetical protein ABJA18_07420 [bacterium]
MEQPKAGVREFPWPHAPVHRLSAKGTYFLTAGTYQKEHFFRGASRVRNTKQRLSGRQVIQSAVAAALCRRTPKVDA